MATLTTGKTWASGETVTPALLNQMVNSATISNIVDADVSASAAIAASKLANTLDLSTKTVTLPDSNIATAKIADSAVTTAKINNAAVTAAKLDGAQTGSAPIYGCRAWVLFNGTKDTTGAASTANTNRQILASGNVSSVTRTSTGTYTVNFTTSMQDANFAAFSTCSAVSTIARNIASGVTSRTASSVSVHVESSDGAPLDQDELSVCIFR